MARIKQGATAAFTLMLVVLIASACNQPYSQQPSVTNTPINATSLFATPIGETPNITMSDVANFGTLTALASSGTPQAIATQTLSVSTQDLGATVTPTAPTSTATLAVSSGVTSAPLGAGEYVLHKDEFPFCIARRSGVNPYDLLRASNLTSPDIYYEGLKVRIPQNSVWDVATLGPRALRTDHSYTVTGNGDTSVYGVACKYGVIDPGAIAQANGVSADAKLAVGQTLTIP